jgi:hypothetical protein
LVLHFLGLARESFEEAKGMRRMGDAGQEPDAERVRPRGEAQWKEHLQAIAQRNERVKATGKEERREREDREEARRRAAERRMDAELDRRLDSRP